MIMQGVYPTPPQLVRLWERGEMTRAQFQAAMAVHAQSILEEIVEDKRNPVVAKFEQMLARRAAARLEKQYGEALVREIFSGLAAEPNFPPACLLWNAIHWDVPLSCFLRVRREPVFRVEKIEERGQVEVGVEVSYGAARKGGATHEVFTMKRDWEGRLVVVSRARVG
ncbi:MAG: hypothetical protein AAGD22_11230 [Verrucomicrobiota bacterium]